MVAERFKIRLAIIYVILSVVVRYVGQAQRDARQQFGVLRGYPLQVVYDALVASAGVCLVYLRVHVLDVYEPFLCVGQYQLNVPARHVETGLNGYAPFLRTLLTESLYVLAVKQGLAAAECHPSAGGKEIQLVYAHLVDKLLHGALHAHRVIRYALRVKAVFAAQRTTVECHERGHALAVHRHAVTRYAYQLACEFSIWHGEH